eukprot:Lithocolla_globosa_v1_NODE_1584_length_2467_cov_5.572139.p2 type:complete len:175 gc:universal NODE_1584_length_2467_cov_5.572139:1489-2013(+)
MMMMRKLRKLLFFILVHLCCSLRWYQADTIETRCSRVTTKDICIRGTIWINDTTLTITPIVMIVVTRLTGPTRYLFTIERFNQPLLVSKKDVKHHSQGVWKVSSQQKQGLENVSWGFGTSPNGSVKQRVIGTVKKRVSEKRLTSFVYEGSFNTLIHNICFQHACNDKRCCRDGG